MSAVTLLQDGDLDGALSELKAEVRDHPDQSRHRVFLFQLLAVLGQWDRALTQLNVLRDLDPGTLSMVQTYQEVLRCEAFRQQVFAAKRTPIVLGEPEPWMAQLIEAARLSAEGNYEAAGQLRARALEDAPAIAGSLTIVTGGTTVDSPPTETERLECAWIADADPRLGPMLEAIVNGRYYWVPFQRIRRIQIEPPSDLRDLVWLPAYFTWTNEGQAAGMIPTRYPGSESQDDNSVRLARLTKWAEPAKGEYEGIGQRLLITDGGEYAITSIRCIELETGESARTSG